MSIMAGGVLTAKQTRPTARGPTTSCRGFSQPALGLRAACEVPHPVADHITKETPIWVRFLPHFRTDRRKRTAARRRGAVAPLRIEALEERSLPCSYVLTNLGTLGGDTSVPLDINAFGQIVGSASTVCVSERAFLWNNGVITDLGTLGGQGGWVTSGAEGIKARDQRGQDEWHCRLQNKDLLQGVFRNHHHVAAASPHPAIRCDS